MSLLFNMLSRLVIAFLPRSKHLLISWLQSPSAVILEFKKIKSVTVSFVYPSICHEVMGPDVMIFVFWMLSFKPTFSLSSFTFIKTLFNYSSLSAIRVVSSAYLRSLLFLPAILIPACASSSSAFLMMYSEYKLNKQGDNIQPWCTHFPILRQHLSSLNQSWLKGKEVKVTGKKAEEFALQSYREVVAKGRWSLFCFNHYVPYMVHRSCLAGGVWPCGLIHSMSPLSSLGSLHVAGTLIAFKCLICAHAILVGLVLS